MKNDINRKIKKIWQRYKGKPKRMPLLFDLPAGDPKIDLLFVGFNPSFNKKYLKDAGKFYKIWETSREWNDYEEESLKREKEAKDPGHKNFYKYFRKFDEIASVLKWESIEICFERETNQAEIKKRYWDNKRKGLTPFGREQFKVFLELLKAFHPKVIIVANAGASKIIKSKLMIKNSLNGISISDFDSECGFHWLSIGRRRSPIFFSGMLSGQRALDNGSFERLRWHVKQAKLKVEDELKTKRGIK